MGIAGEDYVKIQILKEAQRNPLLKSLLAIDNTEEE